MMAKLSVYVLVMTFYFCQTLISCNADTEQYLLEDQDKMVRRSESKTLSDQVEEMLQELRNQNQAIFKHAGHSRILSGKVSEMSREMKLMSEENSDLRLKVELNEFKSAKKINKLKAKVLELSSRLDTCKCSESNVGDSFHSSKSSISKFAKEPDKDPIQPGKRQENRRNKNKQRKNHQKDYYYKEKEEGGNYSAKEADRETPLYVSHPSHGSHLVVDEKDDSWKMQGYNQIFLTSGSSNSSEILDLSQGYDACLPPSDFPLRVQGAVGTFIGGRPLVCGGRSSIEDYYNDCFFYNVNNDSWSVAEPMSERRFQATAVMLSSDMWWITGGFSGDHVYNSTEIYQPGLGFKPGPNMPEVTFQHCLVKFNATHLFSVGGFPYNNNAWILEFANSQWTQQRAIPHLRDAPHCAMVERLNGKVEIVVAGGSLPGSELSTEIFSVTDNRWRSGPNLPQAIIYGVSLPYRNSLLLLGGREMGGDLVELDSILQYDAGKELWSRRDKRLRRRRTSFVAIMLPDYLSCTNNFKPFSSGGERRREKNAGIGSSSSSRPYDNF